MIVSSQLFRSYLECPTKCWLRARAEPPTGNYYAEWVSAQNETYFRGALSRLLVTFPQSDRVTAPPIPKNTNDVTWRLAFDVNWKTRELESCLQAVGRLPANGRGRYDLFIPYRFEYLNKITKEHRLLLAFDALLLSETIGGEVSFGKLVHGDKYETLNVKILPFASEVRKRIDDIAALVGGNTAPELVLNRHCSQCEFQARCHTQAKEKDELSLLSGISQTDRKNLHGKGIFTVTQLSYTFRPRRRRRASRGKEEKHHHSLRALAIRENKIHAVGIPDPKLEGTLVFLDVEGLPDRDFYYLIGVRIQTRNRSDQHSFWASDAKEEGLIWARFLGVLSETVNPRLVCYGSYEKVFLKRMSERYGQPPAGSQSAAAIAHSINILSFIYARIYFPTYSNGLKEITRYLGFRWSGPLTTGLETIAWRHLWEVSDDPTLKNALVGYNEQDCEALELLANKLIDLSATASHEDGSFKSEVVLTTEMKRESPFLFKRNEFVLSEMETINSAAYWNYQRERVYVRSPNKPALRRKRHSRNRNGLVPNTTIEYSRPSSCPTCKSQPIYMHGKKSRIVVDLRFMQHGVKRWITRYIVRRYRCPSCGSIIHPHDRKRLNSRYGPDLVAYTIYQAIELGLPQNRVALSINELFRLDMSRNAINRFKAAAAQAYDGAYSQILKRLCSGRLLHVDETSAGVLGNEGYVWVLTSLE
jgi:predicted RecB family nuclease